ncbi:cytochrome P450 [Boletus reticuloceps]|uniref:Cytochrome P450 n=1 Tax=Boletus reticuloceps TaxID=495285 RepID=A0A8I3A6P7_9AGAM|nr:cytochrome P450 [Boletus reticuloceps]
MERDPHSFGMEFNTGHQAYGDTWRAHRKVVQQCFNSSIIPKYHAAITEKARALMLNLLHSPERFESHMGMFSASIIMAITYGYNVIEKDDPFVGPIEEMIKIAITMTPERAVLLELFPHILKLPIPSWFPGAWLQRLAKRSKELSPKIRDIPFQFVKECLAKGIENDSMVAQCLNDEDKNAAAQDRVSYEQIIKDAATSCFIAGTDTTQATLDTLILAMIMYPEVQDRAQASLDKVVGRDRLPTLNDRASLQYIDAMLREALRWGSLVPMCVPHRVTQDDVFERSLIPKGAVVIPNLWGMARDEEVYPDPTTFNPDRYLDANGNIITDELSGVYFGYGRRVCPGRYLAHTSTWLAGANMLLLFRFSKAIGPRGTKLMYSTSLLVALRVDLSRSRAASRLVSRVSRISSNRKTKDREHTLYIVFSELVTWKLIDFILVLSFNSRAEGLICGIALPHVGCLVLQQPPTHYTDILQSQVRYKGVQRWKASVRRRRSEKEINSQTSTYVRRA